MENQNVTLNLPKDLLREARHLAVERGISLSALLKEFMARAVRDDATYRTAQKRALSRLRKGLPLGVGERPNWSRQSLHDR